MKKVIRHSMKVFRTVIIAAVSINTYHIHSMIKDEIAPLPRSNRYVLDELTYFDLLPVEIRDTVARKIGESDSVLYECTWQNAKTLDGYPQNDMVSLRAGLDRCNNKILFVSDKKVKISVRDADSKLKEAGELEGHVERVNSAKFNREGDKAVTSSDDKTARIWSVSDRKLLTILTGHSDFVFSAQFNDEGDKVVTTSFDRTAMIWLVPKGRILEILRGHTGTVHSAQFNKAGDKIVTASADETVRIWRVSGGMLLATLRVYTDWHRLARFNNEGNHVVTRLGNGKTLFWQKEFISFSQLVQLLDGLDLIQKFKQIIFELAQEIATAGNMTFIEALMLSINKNKHLLGGLWLTEAAHVTNIEKMKILKARVYANLTRDQANGQDEPTSDVKREVTNSRRSQCITQ